MQSGIFAAMATLPAPTPGPVPPRGQHLFGEQQANAFLGLIRAGEALSRALDRGLARDHDIGLHQFEVLLFLAVASDNGCMPMTELRRRTPLSQSRVSRLVSELEGKGLVRRETNPTDSRAVTVTITPQGLEVFEAARPRHHHDLHEHLFSILSTDEINQLAAITAKILAAEQNPADERRTL